MNIILSIYLTIAGLSLLLCLCYYPDILIEYKDRSTVPPTLHQYQEWWQKLLGIVCVAVAWPLVILIAMCDRYGWFVKNDNS